MFLRFDTIQFDVDRDPYIFKTLRLVQSLRHQGLVTVAVIEDKNRRRCGNQVNAPLRAGPIFPNSAKIQIWQQMLLNDRITVIDLEQTERRNAQ